MARKTRVALLAVWSVIALVIFFGLQRPTLHKTSRLLNGNVVNAADAAAADNVVKPNLDKIFSDKGKPSSNELDQQKIDAKDKDVKAASGIHKENEDQKGKHNSHLARSDRSLTTSRIIGTRSGQDLRPRERIRGRYETINR